MLQRGFKSWCENFSLNFRKELGKKKDSPLSPWEVAERLEVKIFKPSELNNLPAEALHALLEEEARSWSAVTVSKGDTHVIIYNSSHAKSRQANDLMHELAHIILKHRPQTNFFSKEVGVLLRQYNLDQEEEADCLARILLLPKDALFTISTQRMPHDQAARLYGVSQPLLTMRMNLTGMNRIFKHTRL